MTECFPVDRIAQALFVIGVFALGAVMVAHVPLIVRWALFAFAVLSIVIAYVLDDSRIRCGATCTIDDDCPECGGCDVCGTCSCTDD